MEIIFSKGFFNTQLSVLHNVGNTVFKFRPEPLPNCNVCKSTWFFSGILMLAVVLFSFAEIS